jgi:uncharacterized protein YtpQ (UPF0354 family)
MSIDTAAPEAPSRDQFANEFIAVLKSADPTKSVSYDADKFCLTIDSECKGGVTANLHNVYREYLQAAPSERPATLRRFLRFLRETSLGAPADFEDAAHDLLPIVRARVGNELEWLRSQVEKSPGSPAFVPFAEHLSLSVGYDLPESITHVGETQLQEWGVTLEVVGHRAMENLAKLGCRFGGLRSKPGVYELDANDGYAVSRLLLPQVFTQPPLSGAPVAMVPHACCLLYTGDRDDDGLRIMLERAEQELEKPRVIGGFAYRLSQQGVWHPWLPAPTHRLYKQFRGLANATLGSSYSRQQQFLTQLQEKYKPADDRLFVASVLEFREESPWGAVTSCSWAKHVPSLLPKTDTISLMRDLEEPPVLVPWNVVQKTVGELMVPQGIYPERYRVDSFPSGSQFAAILGAAKRERRRRHPK